MPDLKTIEGKVLVDADRYEELIKLESRVEIIRERRKRMQKFVKWMLNCDFNRVLSTQNVGFTLIIASLIIATPIQFLRSWIPLAVCMVFLASGLVIWGLGMLWQEIRERAEDLWQNN